MISIVVGVSLIPTIITSIDTASSGAPAGLEALMDVLPYVFVAVILLGAVALALISALTGRPVLKTPRIRGNLKTSVHGNPELSRGFIPRACVETRWGASLGMVV